MPTTTARFDDQKAFTRICEVVPQPNEPVWFVAEESQLPFYPVFDATPHLITAVIGECYGFEYYLVAKDYSWLLGETHHDDLIAAGDPIRPRLAALGGRMARHDEDPYRAECDGRCVWGAILGGLRCEMSPQNQVR